MDNFCCYTSTNTCINIFRKAVLFDSAAFLIKIGVAIYFLILGIQYEIEDEHYRQIHGAQSSSTVILYLFGGIILIVLVLSRLIFNWILYSDSKNPENAFRRPRCCNISWFVVTTGSFMLSCTIVAITKLPLIIQLTGWVSILMEPPVFVIVLLYRRTVRLRFMPDDTDSHYSGIH